MEKDLTFSRSKKIAQEINAHIKLWQKELSRLIIGIDGYSASGKTTVADCLAKENSEVVVIHLDDFLKSSEERVKMMSGGEDKSKVFELNWYRYDLLEKIAEKFKQSVQYSLEVYDYDLKKYVTKNYDLSKPIMLIEGIFLYHPEHAISGVFDKKVYLDVDFEEADNSRIQRDKKRWGNEYVDETHPDSFVKPFKEAYRRYFNDYHPEKLADVVIKAY